MEPAEEDASSVKDEDLSEVEEEVSNKMSLSLPFGNQHTKYVILYFIFNSFTES